MRFECDICHAKYKISDDKVRGRVVRFPCRKCGHKILIDGRQHDADVTVPAGAAYNFDEITRKSEPVSTFSAHEAATARARRPSSPARRRPPSVPPRRPSAASRRVSSVPAAATSAFAGQHPGLAPAVPATLDSEPKNDTGDVPRWHVSINDVPVGPIRLEEMAHKIDAGAVSEYSLVWCEGFEEWRPLATVPELMGLLHERRRSGPPARSSFSSMPPFVETRHSITESSALEGSASAPLPSPPSSFPHMPESADDEIAPLADALQPEVELGDGLNDMSQPPAALGPEGVFPSIPQLGSFSGLPPRLDDRVSVPSAPPETAAQEPQPTSRLSLGLLFLIVAVAVFSAVVAVLAFDRFGDDILKKWVGDGTTTETLPAAVTPDGAKEPPAGTESSAADDAVAAEPGATSEEAKPTASSKADGATGAKDAESDSASLVPPPDPKSDTAAIAPAPPPKPKAKTRPRRRPRAKPTPTSTESAEGESDLSTDDQKLIDEFGSGASAAPATIDVQDSGSAQSKKPPLDGDAVRSTVSANKPRLQRCYERAIRGQQSPPSVRLDVTVTVAASGRVKNVSSEGSGPGGLAECVEASVRRWRFPASSEGGPAKFPIVFSAN